MSHLKINLETGNKQIGNTTKTASYANFEKEENWGKMKT